MAKKLSAEQYLVKFEDHRELQNLAARYVVGFLFKKEEELYEKYWSKREDVCLGFNDGWYVGPDALQGYYNALVEKTKLVAKLVKQKFPEKLGDKTDEELYGTGTFGMKPIDTGVIAVAEDRQTAKGIWFIRGNHSELTTRGPVAYWNWGWLAVDFIMEHDEWKLWHVLEVDDILIPVGMKWAAGPQEPPYEELPEFAAMADFKLPEYTVKQINREYYTADRPATPSPPIPEPYDTFVETFSYGIQERS